VDRDQREHGFDYPLSTIHYPLPFERYHRILAQVESLKIYGRVIDVIGLVIEASMPQVAIGDLCRIHVPQNGGVIPAEVVGFRQGRALLMPLGRVEGIQPGSRVAHFRGKATINVGRQLLGRVIDPMGTPLDERGPRAADGSHGGSPFKV